MIVDVNYNNSKHATQLAISYINKEHNVSLMHFNLAEEGERFTKWVYADEAHAAVPGYVSYDGKPVSLKYAKNFNKFDFMQFLYSLPDETKNALLEFNPVHVYMFDIETEIIDEFPDAENAKTPIVSIAITAPDEKLSTIVLTTDYERINDKVTSEVSELTSQYIKDNFNDEQQVEVRVICCQNEREMLRRFLEIFKKIPAMSAWNCNGYDWPYVKKRLEKNGLSMSDASIDGTVDNNGLPKHKICLDYMELFKKYEFSLRPYESFSLNWVASKSLNLPKLHYDGTLKELRENDIARFLAYNAIDTIIVQLLHKKHDLFNVLYGLCLVTDISIKDSTGPVNQSESVLFKYYLQQQDGDNKIVCPEHGKIEKYSYEGGFVKDPVKHFVKYVACFDYSSLYPSIIRTHNISPTNFILKISAAEVARYESDPNYFISSQNSLYDNSKDTEYKIMETDLYGKRKSYQGDEMFYRREISFKIMQEKKRRGLIDAL